MEKNYIARRRGTSVAAAALSFALVAPFAQPVAFAQDTGQPGVSGQPSNEPEGVQEDNELPAGVGEGDLEDPAPSDDPNEGLGEAVESPRPADVPTQRGGIEVVWADAIDNGYIRTATGLTNAQSTLSGRAYEFSARGNVRPTANGQRAVPEGTTVYMQWVDNDGAVSPIYAAKTRAAIGTDGGQGGPGVYAFDLRKPWFDANGKEHVFRAWGGSATQQYRLWIDDYTNDEGVRYTAMTQKNGFFPGSYVGTATSRNNGAFPLLGQNMQRTAVFMHAQPENKVEALTRPRDEWIDATAMRDDEGNPLGVETKIGRVDLATVANPTYNTINGSVWLETGAGEGGNFQTGPGRNYNSGDVPAQGYTVVLSQLSPAGYRRYQDEVRTKPEQERNEFSLQWLRDNGNGVIEATYYTTTDRDGNYSIQMPNRLPNTVKPLDNIWMTVLDPKAEEQGELKELAAFSPWMLPQFHNATALGTRAANSYWPNHRGEGPITEAIKHNHRNYSFAVIPDYQVNLDIENFNVTDKPATVGNGEVAQLKASGVVPVLPTHIEWRVGDSVIKGGSEECPVTGVKDLGACATLDVDAEYEIGGETRKLRDGDVVRAVMVTGTQHTNDIASDSFVIRDTNEELDANEYELAYPDSNSVTAGEETTIPAPTQPNGDPFPVDESDPDNPKPTRFAPVLDPNFPVVDKDGKPVEFPGEVTVNPDGTITVKPNEDAKPGDEFKIPVIVRYPDNSAETIYADVQVVPNYDPVYPGKFTPQTTDEDKNKGEGTIAQAGEPVTAKPEFKTTKPAEGVTVTYKLPEGFETPAGYNVTVDEKTGKVTFEVADIEKAKATPVVEVPVEVSYSDGSATDTAPAVFYLDTDKDGIPDVDDEDPENPNVPAPKQNTEFDPQYNGGEATEVKQGETKKITPADKDGKGLPDGTTYEGKNNPDWVSVDPNTGEITLAPTDEVTLGEHTVTVEVTYPDGSKDTIETTVTVTKPENNQTGGTGDNDDQNTGKTNVSVGEDGIQTVKPTDDEQGTGIIIKNNGDDTKITVKDEDKKEIPFTIDPETGEIKVTPGTDVDGPVTVIIEDTDLPGGQTQFEVPVEGHTKGQDDNNSGTPGGNETSVGVGEDGIQTVKPTDDEQGTGIIIKNNGDDTKITVKDEDKKDIPYTIDPETGEIKVTPGTDVDGPIIITVEDDDLPGGKGVFEVPVKDKDGNEHKIGVDDNAANYGDRTEVKPGEKRNSKRPVADSVKIEKAQLNEADREKGGWSFTVDSKTGVVTATAPNTGMLQELFDREFLNNAPADWNDFVNRFKNTGQPDVEVALSFEGDRDGEKAVAGFVLVGKDGKSIFDKDGDFDGDGTSNYDELFNSEIDWSKTTPKPFGPIDNSNNPSSMSDEDWAKCKVGLGIGVPLIGLLPLGLLLAAGLPALEPVARDISKQIEDANAALQRQIGIFNPESAAQVKQINDQLKEFGLNLVTGGALLILVPLVIGGIAAIADNCAPGGQARSAELSSNRD